MIALIQRVSYANVKVADGIVAEIDKGILALVGIESDDSFEHVEKMIQRILYYRIFPDAAGKMNLSLSDMQGGLLLVPQFTLAANTRKGSRPSFSSAASPEQARSLFECVCSSAKALYANVSCGVFGADMAVNLCNDGPVTFWLQV